MSEVANELAATGITGFLQRLYKPIIQWANSVFATKDDVAAIEGTLTPASTTTCEAIVSELV